MSTFKVCTIFGDFYREAETAEQARREFWEWFGMTDQRVDELFVVREGRELDELEELLLARSEEGLPPDIKGNLVLARTQSGKWRIRGSKGGVAEWDTETQWWRIRQACPACGSEWWNDEPAPRNPCCQSADFAGGAG